MDDSSEHLLPEPKQEFDDTDHRRMGEHGLDKYEVEEARWDLYRELQDQLDGGDGYYNLTDYRKESDWGVKTLENALWFLRVVDRFPIQQGPTAFVGWYERFDGDRVENE